MNSRETLVAWSKDYSLGLDAIDEQHKTLLDIMNRLWAAIIHRAGSAETLVLIGDLEKYTVTHFGAEEAFMRATQYEDLIRHKKAHDEFVARIAAERKRIEAGGIPSLELLKFLKEWLVQHILVSDRAYADAYRQGQDADTLLGRFFQRFLT